MTPAEFEAVRPLLRISEDRVRAARLALVDGQTLQGVANIYKWSRQAVGDAVAAVWRTFERYQESQRAAIRAGPVVPLGWEQVTLIAPSSLIAQFKVEIEAAAQAAAKKVPAKRALSAKKGRA